MDGDLNYTDLISSEENGTLHVLPLSATNDPRVLLLGPAFPLLPDALYVTADQVFPDLNSSSLGVYPGIFEFGDVGFLNLDDDDHLPEVNFTEKDFPPEPPQPNSSDDYRLPAKKKRKAAQPIICVHCSKKFMKNFDFLQHLRSHTKEKPFICIVCGLAFTQKCNVKKHLLTHLVWNPTKHKTNLPNTTGHLPRTTIEGKSLDKGFECQICMAASFKCYNDYRVHLKSHANEKVFECILPTCDVMPSTIENLLIHAKTHEGLKEYKCQLCPAEFKNLYQFSFHNYAHRKSNNETEDGQTQRLHYRCDICLKKFAEPEKLKEHRDAEGHLFNCPYCSSKFPQERYLRRHLAVHCQESAHLCDQCGKRFKLKHHLSAHALTHAEKSFACHVCAKAFARSDQLARHVKAVHQPNTLRCNDCNKTFSRKDKLKEHLKYKRTRCLPLREAAT